MRLVSELWRDIEIFRGVDFGGKYKISSKGRVLNVAKNRFLTPYANDEHKYPYVTLTKGKVNITAPVHRLVCENFLINPNSYKHVNHKDENPSNFDINNLEWCTQKYNNNYGTHGAKIAKALGVPIVQLDTCGNLIKVWASTKEAGRNGFNNGNICMCINKKKKTHSGYIWLREEEYNSMTKDEVVAYCKNKDKRIAQVDKEWNLIHVYDSLKEIDQTKYCESMIYDVIRGKREFYKDCRWMKYSTYLLRDY